MPSLPGGRVVRSSYTRVRSVSFELLVMVTGVCIYFGVRGATAGSRESAVAHARDIVALERRLGLGAEHWFQGLVINSSLLGDLMNWIYIWGHWPVITVSLIWLALRNRIVYLRLRNGMLISGGLGLMVYTTYPVAPPRLAGLGLVDTVSERSHAYRVLQPPAFVNQYAAMPSLHVGWDLLVGMALFAAATWTVVRVIGVIMPIAMALATVTTANHYVLDVLAGAALALVGHAAALAIEHRRHRREHVATAPTAQPPEPSGAPPSTPSTPSGVVPCPRRADEESTGPRAEAVPVPALARAAEHRRLHVSSGHRPAG